MLDLVRSGLILHTEKYEACVEFYRDRIGLPVEFEKNEPDQILTLLTLGGSYLMIEPGGIARAVAKAADENPVTIRFNVPDVDASADRLRQVGIDVAVSKFSWGTIGDFCDPDGNRCQFRETVTFGR